MKKAKAEQPAIRVKFQKWHDPFFDNYDEWPKQRNPDDAPLGEAEDTPNIDHIKEMDEEDLVPSKPVAYLATSMGPMSLTEYTQPSKVFNFWVGHTNVNLTPKMCKAISRVDGVEVLTVFSRYRFRVGIGKMFMDGNVQRGIKATIIDQVKLAHEAQFPKL